MCGLWPLAIHAFNRVVSTERTCVCDFPITLKSNWENELLGRCVWVHVSVCAARRSFFIVSSYPNSQNGLNWNRSWTIFNVQWECAEWVGEGEIEKLWWPRAWAPFSWRKPHSSCNCFVSKWKLSSFSLFTHSNWLHLWRPAEAVLHPNLWKQFRKSIDINSKEFHLICLANKFFQFIDSITMQNRASSRLFCPSTGPSGEEVNGWTETEWWRVNVSCSTNRHINNPTNWIYIACLRINSSIGILFASKQIDFRHLRQTQMAWARTQLCVEHTCATPWMHLTCNMNMHNKWGATNDLNTYQLSMFRCS